MRRWTPVLRLVGLGWYVAFCIILGLLGGIWLDGRLHVAPLFTLVGLALGLITAFLGLYRMVAAVEEEERHREDS